MLKKMARNGDYFQYFEKGNNKARFSHKSKKFFKKVRHSFVQICTHTKLKGFCWLSQGYKVHFLKIRVY